MGSSEMGGIGYFFANFVGALRENLDIIILIFFLIVFVTSIILALIRFIFRLIGKRSRPSAEREFASTGKSYTSYKTSTNNTQRQRSQAYSRNAREDIEGEIIPAPDKCSVRIAKALALISRRREKLKPPRLGSDIFPHDLNVIEFNPKGKLRIRTTQLGRGRLFVGLFCLPHYLIFPGMIGALFGSFFLGSVVGLGLWIWRNYLGEYVSINFADEKYALISPVYGRWKNGHPRVVLKTVQHEDTWMTTLTIANQDVVERVTDEEPDNADLETFVKSLNWRLGRPSEIAEGVYISP